MFGVLLLKPSKASCASVSRDDTFKADGMSLREFYEVGACFFDDKE